MKHAWTLIVPLHCPALPVTATFQVKSSQPSYLHFILDISYLDQKMYAYIYGLYMSSHSATTAPVALSVGTDLSSVLLKVFTLWLSGVLSCNFGLGVWACESLRDCRL